FNFLNLSPLTLTIYKKPVSVAVHSYDFFRSWERNNLVLTQNSKKCEVSYEIMEMKSLKEPYYTGCRDYREEGFKSRYDCKDKCALKVLEERKEVIPFNMMKEDWMTYNITLDRI